MTDIDTLIGNADVFPALRSWTYLNHAGLGPLPRVVADAVRRFAAEAEAGGYLDANWFTEPRHIRANAAAWINADPAEIAFVQNTSEGISTVAFGLDFRPGDRVVFPAVEYPANVYPWMEVARRSGIELVTVPEETAADGTRFVSPEKLLAAADHPRTRVVTLSHVQYASGQRFDLAPIGRFCRERDIFFNVDVIQSLGVFPVDVRAMCIDALSACGHKWMLGPAGAGLMYVRREWQDRVRPLLIGATSVVDFLNYGDIDYTLRPDATRYESGTPNIAGVLGWGKAVELLAGVGADAIATRCKTLTDRFAAGVQGKGYHLVSPRDGERWSGMVCFTSPAHDHETVQMDLRKRHRIEIAVRERRLRCSPHFYNTEAQIDATVAALPGH